MKRLELTGDHPYFAAAGPVSVDVSLHGSVPGREVAPKMEKLSKGERAELEPGEAWVKLAGPYFIAPGFYTKVPSGRIGDLAATLEQGKLLALLWDLMGQPMCPGGPRRRRASFLVVEALPGEVNVYRDLSEMTGDWLNDAEHGGQDGASAPGKEGA